MNHRNLLLVIGSLALVLLLSQAKAALHRFENVPAREVTSIQSIMDSIEANMSNIKRPRGDVHGKSHACLSATFEIVAEDKFPANVARKGIFAKSAGEKWDATIRISSGSGQVEADRNPDARGFAIKIHNVIGDKVFTKKELGPTGDNFSQVFTAVSYPGFFVKNAHDYTIFAREQFKRGDALGAASFILGLEDLHFLNNQVIGDLAKALSGPTKDFDISKFFVTNVNYSEVQNIGFQEFVNWLKNPSLPHPRLVEQFNLAMILALGGAMGNPLQYFYHSQLPYANGEDQAFKYRLKPCNDELVFTDPLTLFGGATSPLVAAVTTQLLPANLAKDGKLETKGKDETEKPGACFEFQVQLHKKGMPIEDPTVIWNEIQDPIAFLIEKLPEGKTKETLSTLYTGIQNNSKFPRLLTSQHSEFETVAIIEIPRQAFDPKDNRCERVSFNPGFGLKANRVLGGIGRTRLPVYSRVLELRTKAHAVGTDH